MKRPVQWCGVLLLLALAGGFIGLAGTTLLGDVYLLAGQSSAKNHAASLRTLAAARKATRLLPWSAQARALKARVWQSHDAPTRTRQAQLQALRLAPGRWQSWQAIYESGLKNNHPAVIHYAQSMLEKLAPNSDGMNLRNALLGLAYWQGGNKAMHAFWHGNIIHSLKRRPKTLLYRVYQINGAHRLCKLVPPAQKQTRYQTWCSLVPKLKITCHLSTTLTPKQKQWCRVMGATS